MNIWDLIPYLFEMSDPLSQSNGNSILSYDNICHHSSPCWIFFWGEPFASHLGIAELSNVKAVFFVERNCARLCQ